ncbi:uncharacterized protein [Palaemon carinicauda]|uniref:uncharacterized protein n=1 Tax=Palaemon carinicauda TaxID=392227 RepID=UPI0035B63EE2
MRTSPGLPNRPCGTFMSSLETDPHALCPLCRGQRCDKENVCSEGRDLSASQWEKFGRRRKKKPKRDRSPSKVTLKKEVSRDFPCSARTSSEGLPRPASPPSEGRVGPPVSPASSSPPRGSALSETPLRRTDDPDSLPRGRIRRKARRNLRERGLPSPYQGVKKRLFGYPSPPPAEELPRQEKAPSPSGEKVSGVKSLALVRAPALLRVVERRSSSPTHQRSPVRPHSPTRQRSPRSPAHQRSPVRQRSPGHPEKGQCLPTRQRSPTRQSSPAPPSRSSNSDARKGSPLPHTSIPALPVAPARPSISERLLSLAHSRQRSPTACPSRQHAVGPAGSKEGASPSCAPITDRSARHQLREIKSSRRHLSPSHHHQHSPKRSRGHSPALSLERSPTRSYARSPTRSRAYPPARHSPARHSPARSHARAPAHVCHHSQPYDRLSPTRERSPTGRSPTRYRATSPARETVFTNSPGRGTAPAREGLVVTTPKGRERPFSPAGIADTASVTRLPWFRT